MDWFKPSSASISSLAEVCLSLTVLAYVLNFKNKTRDTRLYIGLMILLVLWSIIAFLFNSNVYSTTAGAYFTEWSNAFLLIAIALYRLWFAYEFGSNPFRREMPYVLTIFTLLSGYWLIDWYRLYSPSHDPPLNLLLFGGAVIAAVALYSVVIFLRKLIAAGRVYEVGRRSFRHDDALKEKMHILSKGLNQPGTRETRAYRGFLIWALIYLLEYILVILSWLEIIGHFFWVVSFHILLLVNIVQSVFVLLNYASEKNSFQAKLVWVVLCVVLIILGLLPFVLFGGGAPSIADAHPEIKLKIFLWVVPLSTITMVILLPAVFRYNILRPLERIMQGVKTVSNGDLSADVKVEANDEIGVLSRNFNQMTESLRTYSVKMEELVAERTAQLQNSLNDLKSTQAQLIQSEKMASLGELTAGIAHEIQNPLNFVNNFSELNKELISEMRNEIDTGNLNEAKSISKDVEENEEKINFHGKRADAIVKGMLQHSRASSGVKEPTDINALADEYLRLAYHGLRAKDKSFNAIMKTDYDDAIGNINIVPQDIGRVILNLITNAFYAVTEKKQQQAEGYEPTVSVSTKKLNGKVEIKVKDNGNGIPQKVLDKIFQPFFTTKPTGQGTGLGLSLAYDIIKAHGGEIKVETKERKGSTFIIQLLA
ncbi:MAG: sensor histidine kinase [Chitinophagales bacterium]